ncbi:MAG TPA: hypothetical protein VG273_03985 [Bryobacteraceae bacterium]|jgi:DNA-binding CsgD family transcriptional regulator|nr:hypothetical protein [Bryobacteraceae bacterium]
MSDSRTDPLLDVLYEACGDESLWTEFFSAAARAFDAPIVGLIAQSRAEGRYAVAGGFGVDEKASRLYNEYWAGKDPWYLALKERQATEWIGRGTDLLPQRQFESTEYYNDYHKRWASTLFQCGIVYLKAGATMVLTLQRERNRGDFVEDEIRSLQELFPHLRRALSIHRNVLDLKQTVSVTGSLADVLDIGVLGVDHGLMIKFANSVAESMLKSADLLTTRDGRLATCDSDSTDALARAVRAALGCAPATPAGASLRIRNRDRTLHLTVLPTAPSRTILMESSTALVMISDPEAAPATRERILGQLFQLTPAEIRVAMLLVGGMEPNEIAEKSRTTSSTVRFQLKVIYRKTGVSRQSQLVRLISMLPGIRTART